MINLDPIVSTVSADQVTSEVAKNLRSVHLEGTL